MSASKDLLQNRILNTQQQIALIEESYRKLGLPKYLIDLEVSSLNLKLNELENELLELEKEEHKKGIIVTLHPPGFESGHIPVRSLSVILGNVQSLTDAIANAEYNNSHSNHGPLPNDIIERNSLIIRDVKAGSFKVYLDFPNLEEDQMTFIDKTQENCVLDTMSLLLNSSKNDEQLLEVISDLGDRVLNKYIYLLKSLKDFETPIDLDFKNKNNIVNKISLKMETINSLYNNLNDKLECTESLIEISGVLTGANLRTCSFEIYTDDQDKISGLLPKDLGAELKLGKKYKAEILEKTTLNKATNKSKTMRKLRSLIEL